MRVEKTLTRTISSQLIFEYYFLFLISLSFAKRAGSPQQHVPIAVGPYYLDMLILVREKNRSTRRKTLQAQERSTTRIQLT